MKKMCIVVPTLSGGGAEKVAVNLANYYADAGITVDLVVFIKRGPYIKDVSRKVNIIDLGVRRTRYAMFGLIKYFWKNRPDYALSVVRDSNIFVGLSFLLMPKMSIRVAYREANTLAGLEKRGWVSRTLTMVLMKLSYSQADVVIANSEDTKSDVVNAKISKAEKILVISNPVVPHDVDAQAREPIFDSWFSDPRLRVILGVGRLHEQKNFSLLIRAFALVYEETRNARLVIIGEGEEERKLLALVSELGLENVVKILGFKPRIYPFFKQSAVFVLTSRWEGFGNVIVDALAVGTPIVSANCPGGPRMILDDGRYGTLVRDSNPYDFARAISAVLSRGDLDVHERAILVERSRQYSIPAVAKRYFDAISSA